MVAEMSLIHVTDAGGDSIPYVEFRGVLFPAFPIQSITEYIDLTFRPDDVVICSYPKSGIHWVQEITRLLQQGRLDNDAIGKENFMIEMQPNKSLDALPSPRILNTNVIYRNLPADALDKKCKIVLLLRNPKDALVSMYNFILKLDHFHNYYGKWENFFKLAMEGKTWHGPWWDFVRQWERDMANHPESPVLVLWYEDLVEDTLREIRRINEFLGFNRDDKFMESLSNHVTFTNMKAIKTAPTGENQNAFHDVVFRKGNVGDWKNWFTLAQNEEFDQRFNEEMKGSKIKCRFTLPAQL